MFNSEFNSALEWPLRPLRPQSTLGPRCPQMIPNGNSNDPPNDYLHHEYCTTKVTPRMRHREIYPTTKCTPHNLHLDIYNMKFTPQMLHHKINSRFTPRNLHHE